MDSLQNNDKAHGSAHELPMRLYLVDSYTLVPWSPLQKKKKGEAQALVKDGKRIQHHSKQTCL